MFQAAADVIRQAHALIITAGAGMGVDSGLPDFRGTSGFWQAYPPYAKRGLSFAEAANPLHFQRDPSFGWGFYGHRCNLYRSTTPHEGFHILQRWIRRTNAGHFIVTSNVDGQFQKAGFDESDILEVHGSIHHLQCLEPCHDSIWPNDEIFDIDTQAMRSRSIPRCPRCGSVSRPNILMFGDWSWLSGRTDSQQARFQGFLNRMQGKRWVVIELGAGTAIPTIRATSERLGRRLDSARVIRINPREAAIRHPHLSLPCNALEGLRRIDRFVGD